MAFSADKIEDCLEEVEKDGKKLFKCAICCKELSSKQRALLHLKSIHNKDQMKPTKKLYCYDKSKKIPRRTDYRFRMGQSKLVFVGETHVGSSNIAHTANMDVPDNNWNITDAITDADNITDNSNLSNNYTATVELESRIYTEPTITYRQDLVTKCNDDTMADDSSEDDFTGETDECSFESSSDYIDSDESLESDGEISNMYEEKDIHAMVLLTFITRHNLSNRASKDLLDVVKSVTDRNSPLNKLSTKDIFNLVGEADLTIYHYCGSCGQTFPMDDPTSFSCSTTSCNGLRYVGGLNQQQRSKKPRNTFIIGNVKEALKQILERPKILNIIRNRKLLAANFRKHPTSNVSDIIFSNYYQLLSHNGQFLSHNYNISAQFNTDGVKLRKSSGVKLWPIYLAINELPANIRFHRENMILAGLWQGKGQPPYFHYTEKFSEIASDLYYNGFTISDDGRDIHVRVGVFLATMDLPAKCKILNMTQFNGMFGCSTCEEPGIREKKGKGTVQAYPYRIESEKHPQRDSNDIILNKAPNATISNRIIGIIGYSGLTGMDWFDLVLGVVPDYMHGALLGVTKALMYLWFSPTHSKNAFFIGLHLKKISKRMNSIRPPNCVERLPKDLEFNYGSFKATEYQIFLIYYGIPCLHGILPDIYLQHFACLSEAFHIMLREEINEHDLCRADELCTQFYSDFGRLYGEENCGLNVHNIGSHVVDFVRTWGSVTEWSNFGYEDENGHLIKSVIGTGDVTRELFRMKLASNAVKCLNLDKFSDEKYKLLIKSVQDKGKGWKNLMKMENCNIVTSMSKVICLDDDTQTALIQACNAENINDVKIVKRIVLRNNIHLYSKEYTRMKRHVSDVVLLNTGRIAQIQKYYVNIQSNMVYADIIYFKLLPECYYFQDFPKHLVRVELSDESDIVNVLVIKEMLFFVQCHANDAIICRVPNLHGHSVLK